MAAELRTGTGRHAVEADPRARRQERLLPRAMFVAISSCNRKTVVFVTHDIEETIFLANRVVVMSSRRGRIKADIKVDLPHPRPYKVKTTPEFVRLRERLVEEIRAEALKVATHV
mgnify:CR=1 FL=1